MQGAVVFHGDDMHIQRLGAFAPQHGRHQIRHGAVAHVGLVAPHAVKRRDINEFVEAQHR
ncbi:hypothetical protein D3C85_1718700 [compost metagenome]